MKKGGIRALFGAANNRRIPEMLDAFYVLVSTRLRTVNHFTQDQPRFLCNVVLLDETSSNPMSGIESFNICIDGLPDDPVLQAKISDSETGFFCEIGTTPLFVNYDNILSVLDIVGLELDNKAQEYRAAHFMPLAANEPSEP